MKNNDEELKQFMEMIDLHNNMYPRENIWVDKILEDAFERLQAVLNKLEELCDEDDVQSDQESSDSGSIGKG